MPDREIDDMFARLRKIGETGAALRAARRQQIRDARNARRRARYAASPKPARTRTRTRPAVVNDEVVDEVVDEGCRCNVVRMPPCSWCESGGVYDDE